MKTLSTHGLLCALLVLSACTKSLTIDEGQGNAGAAGSGAGEGGDGEAGEAGEAGGSAGEAGEAGGSAGEAGGSAGEAGGSAGEAGGSAGAAGDEDDGPGGSTAGAPLATTRWTGNDPSCPSSPQFSGACDVEEGLVCGYYHEEGGDTHYSECACQMHCTEGGSELRWECTGVGGGMLEQCPAEQPEQGSDCFGKKGVSCYYPVKVTCDCPSDPNDSSWRCVNDLGRPTREHPEDVDPNAIVAELTAEQRAAWCAWYVPPTEPGFPEPEVEEPDANGFYPDTGCAASSTLGCNTAQPGGLPRQACEANLALSTCGATVHELTDCALTAAGHGPSPNGCARYFASAGCSGTIVNQVSGVPNAGWGMPGDNSCRVRVE